VQFGHLFFLWIRSWLWTSAGLWIWRAVIAGTGLPRLPNLLDPQWDAAPVHGPRLAVVVPACNEEQTIEAGLRSLLAQDYEDLRIIAVDDRSTDRTRSLMEALAAAHPSRLSVVSITELPEGWLGKTHAMSVGAEAAEALDRPAWLLFTDADVLFAPEALRRSLAAAQALEADHFVTLPTPLVRRADEDVFLSFFQVMSFWAVRLWRVSHPRHMRDSVGVGAFALLRREAYARLGGFNALRLEILEDLYLGRRVKEFGLRQCAAFGRNLVRIHWAPGALGVVQVLTKNLFAVFRFRLSLVLFSAFWLVLFTVGPFAGIFFHAVRVPSILAVAAIAYLYHLASRYSGVSGWTVVFAPFASLLLTYSLLRSALITLQQGGVRWRGTFYPLHKLRAHAGPLFPRRAKTAATS
jgi:glycosyltransferase involved in cell wall biosynthesis